MPGTPLPTINGVTIPRHIWKRILDRLVPTDQPHRSASLKRLCRLDKEVRQRVRDLAVEFLREECVITTEAPTDPDWIAKLEAVMAPPETPASPPDPLIEPTAEKVVETATPSRPVDLSETATPPKAPQHPLKRPVTAQHTNAVILGGSDEGVDARQLFPGITAENMQDWRYQSNEAAERERLIQFALEYERRKNHF